MFACPSSQSTVLNERLGGRKVRVNEREQGYRKCALFLRQQQRE